MEDTEFHLWAKVLVYLYNHQDEKVTGWIIGKKLNISSTASISNIVKLLVKKKLLETELRGRTYNYTVTDKGSKVAEYLNKIFIILK